MKLDLLGGHPEIAYVVYINEHYIGVINWHMEYEPAEQWRIDKYFTPAQYDVIKQMIADELKIRDVVKRLRR